MASRGVLGGVKGPRARDPRPHTQPRPSRFVINRLPQDDDELWWTIFGLWGYRIPRHNVCAHHTAPFTALADAYFARHPVTIWKASRGLGGKSRTLAILGLLEASLLGVEVTILGGSTAQSRNVHDATKEAWAWHAAPKGLQAKPPTTFDTVLTNGGHLRTLTASQTSVRGPHPPRLRMDEIDEMDQAILDAALGQPMEQTNYLGNVINTQVVMSSTHQYPDRTMSTMLARAKEQGFPVLEWCWKDTSNPVDGWLTEPAIKRTRSIVPELMWKTEYDLQEPSFGLRAIDTDAVIRAFDAELGHFPGQDVFFQRPAEQGRHYITAVDWAKTRDHTIVATFDTTERPWVCVAWQKTSRLPWPMLVRRAVEQWRVYGDKFVHDATGVGAVAHDLIRELVTTWEFNRVRGVTLTGGRERDALYTEYVAAIEHHDLVYPRIDYAFDEHRYVTPEALYTSAGHVPDSIVAGALAWLERRKQVKIAAPGGGIRGSSPWVEALG